MIAATCVASPFSSPATPLSRAAPRSPRRGAMRSDCIVPCQLVPGHVLRGFADSSSLEHDIASDPSWRHADRPILSADSAKAPLAERKTASSLSTQRFTALRKRWTAASTSPASRSASADAIVVCNRLTSSMEAVERSVGHCRACNWLATRSRRIAGIASVAAGAGALELEAGRGGGGGRE